MVRDIKRDLEYKIHQEYYYSDSNVVLGYIMNETKRFYIYVTNRVEVIRSQTSPHQWRHIETEKNPADLASRGCNIEKLVKGSWLTGPEFLWESLNNIPFEKFHLKEEDEEIRCETKTCKTNINQTCSLCKYFENYQDWNKLRKAVAVLKLFVRYLRQRVQHEKLDVNFNTEVLMEAESTIICHIQKENFSEEIEILKHPSKRNKKSQLKGLPLQRLDPFIDERSVLRVGGRLRRVQWPSQEQYPAILPKKSHVTSLVIRHYHEVNHHQRRLITHGSIRQAGFWIIGGAQLVSSYIHNCIKCNFLRKPTEKPKMSDLPEERLDCSPPFTNVGMDAFGPWEVMTKRTRGGSANSKRWGIIFTCLASRAIHIEIVDGMDTSAFINALRRFLAIRGPVRMLWSNFIGARAELNKALKEVNNEKIKSFLTARECEWSFNPPHASHFGGVWERQIGTLRRVLDGMLLELGKSQLTHDLLVTLMTEASAIVNARPLTAISTDPENPEILSPASILTFKSKPYLPAPGEFTKPDQ